MNNHKVLFAAMLLLVPASANAYVECQGQILSFEVRPTGEFTADWGYGNRLVCSMLNGNAACQAIMAQFMTAYAQRQKIISHHVNSTTCAQVFAPGTWAPAEPATAYTLRAVN